MFIDKSVNKGYALCITACAQGFNRRIEAIECELWSINVIWFSIIKHYHQSAALLSTAHTVRFSTLILALVSFIARKSQCKMILALPSHMMCSEKFNICARFETKHSRCNKSRWYKSVRDEKRDFLPRDRVCY